MKNIKKIFSKDGFDLGCAKGIVHSIDTGDNSPIHSRAIRRIQFADITSEEEVKKLLDSGMLILSSSPWASPLLIVKKKYGSNRVVIDYRKLNHITKKDCYPLPRIDDALDKLGGAKFFFIMDLILGYWQIELPTPDQEKCAIICN